TKASQAPSGDQRRVSALPRAWTSWTAFSLLFPSSDADQTWPPLTKATRSPRGEIAAALPSPTLRGAPPSQETAQTSCLKPPGSLVGFGPSPSPFAPPPRV